MVGSSFASSAILNELLTLAVWDTYELCYSLSPSFFDKQGTVTVAADATTGTLPSDFYRLKAARLLVDDDRYLPLRPFGDDEPLTLESFSWGTLYLPKYRVRHFDTTTDTAVPTEVLAFNCAPTEAQGVLVGYHWGPPALSSDTTVIGVPFADHYIVGAAIRLKERERTDAASLIAERERLEERIRQRFGPTDHNPAGIYDARSIEDDAVYPWGRRWL
jgi:hypothetical protein